MAVDFQIDSPAVIKTEYSTSPAVADDGLADVHAAPTRALEIESFHRFISLQSSLFKF